MINFAKLKNSVLNWFSRNQMIYFLEAGSDFKHQQNHFVSDFIQWNHRDYAKVDNRKASAGKQRASLKLAKNNESNALTHLFAKICASCNLMQTTCNVHALPIGNKYTSSLRHNRLFGCKWTIQYTEYWCAPRLSPINNSFLDITDNTDS